MKILMMLVTLMMMGCSTISEVEKEEQRYHVQEQYFVCKNATRDWIAVDPPNKMRPDRVPHMMTMRQELMVNDCSYFLHQHGLWP